MLEKSAVDSEVGNSSMKPLVAEIVFAIGVLELLFWMFLREDETFIGNGFMTLGGVIL